MYEFVSIRLLTLVAVLRVGDGVVLLAPAPVVRHLAVGALADGLAVGVGRAGERPQGQRRKRSCSRRRSCRHAWGEEKQKCTLMSFLCLFVCLLPSREIMHLR